MESVKIYEERTCPICGLQRTVQRRTSKTNICRSCKAKQTHPLIILPDSYIRGEEIGKAKGTFYFWSQCPECYKYRWVRVSRAKDYITRYCLECARRALKKRKIQGTGEKNSNWKGGRFTSPLGYISIKINPDNFYFSMANKKGYVPEHRLIMAQFLGRCLHAWEVIHHKNGVRSDNKIQNLELMTKNTHSADHSKGYRDGYKKGYLDGRSKALIEAQTIVDEQCIKDNR